jgi:hypothetical protein
MALEVEGYHHLMHMLFFNSPYLSVLSVQSYLKFFQGGVQWGVVNSKLSPKKSLDEIKNLNH